MDPVEARALAQARLEELRALGYDKLKACFLEKPETAESAALPERVISSSSRLRGDRESGNLRVWVMIDNGGRRAFAPLVEDFIVAPDGSFVGE